LIDLHLHTTASDGMLAPSDLVARAAAAGITVLSVTDHDTTAGYDEARDGAALLGVTLVPGIEVTAVESSRDVHILGYFIDSDAPSLAEFLTRQRADRLQRVVKIGERLRDLGFPVDVEPLLRAAARSGGRSIGRPQIADALIQRGYARDRDDAFDRLLGDGKPAFVARTAESPERVVGVIREAGGIASLAHPGLLRRDDLIPRLARAGLTALEVCHSEHDAAAERHYRDLAERYGLLVSGGSDYHGDFGRRASVLGVVTLPRLDFERLLAAAA
jgi:predicted metal-dependent phosphoesterase TrpH